MLRSMKTIWQVVVGAALCFAIAEGLVYGPFPILWEHEDEPHVYSITWHSAVVLLLLMVVTQWLAHLLFRWIGSRKRNPGAIDQ
jgi:membrane protein YdbS with pleckstrin-like domain